MKTYHDPNYRLEVQLHVCIHGNCYVLAQKSKLRACARGVRGKLDVCMRHFFNLKILCRDIATKDSTS